MSFDFTEISEQHNWPQEALEFCEGFCHGFSRPKFILGRNIYSESVARLVNVSGFIDDYTEESQFLRLPIVKIRDVPRNALVLNSSGGRPLTARSRLNREGLKNLDYFAFSKISGLPVPSMRFNEGFQEEFRNNQPKYEWIYQRLADKESQEIFEKLIKFRFNYDITHLEGFSQLEKVQYFENFLALKTSGEMFVDVGCFDGCTSLEFIKHCPNYRAIHAFEPDATNFEACRAAFAEYPNIHCYRKGLSRSKGTMKFNTQGSASRISSNGSVQIEVDRLDDILNDAPTFIKMDIEGGESAALEGAKQTILKHHSRLAISVYHSPKDFWLIPKQILTIRDDYEVRLRHYTECIYESVMFFLPRH